MIAEVTVEPLTIEDLIDAGRQTAARYRAERERQRREAEQERQREHQARIEAALRAVHAAAPAALMPYLALPDGWDPTGDTTSVRFEVPGCAPIALQIKRVDAGTWIPARQPWGVSHAEIKRSTWIEDAGDHEREIVFRFSTRNQTDDVALTLAIAAEQQEEFIRLTQEAEEHNRQLREAEARAEAEREQRRIEEEHRADLELQERDLTRSEAETYPSHQKMGTVSSLNVQDQLEQELGHAVDNDAVMVVIANALIKIASAMWDRER